jgi:hypothetical protein
MGFLGLYRAGAPADPGMTAFREFAIFHHLFELPTFSSCSRWVSHPALQG